MLTPKISLIIPTFRRQAVLCDTLKMAVGQDYPDYEVIVVDQTPTVSAELSGALAELGDRVHYIRLETPNLPRARNAGVRRASGDIIVFIDDDVVIAPSYIAQHARHYSDSRVGGVCGLTMSRRDPEGRVALADYSVMCAGGTSLRHGDVVPVRLLIGGNTSYRRRAFVDAGGSDERFYGSASAEDIDLAWRVNALGYELFMDTNIRMLHLELEAGGCENRNRDPERAAEIARQQKELWLYCVLKNQRSVTRKGRAAVWMEMWRYYRHAALNRGVFLNGMSDVVKQHSTVAFTVRRARQLAHDARISAPIADGAFGEAHLQ